MYLYINNGYKRKENDTFKGKQRDNVNKAKPLPTFSCYCRNLKSKKTMGGGGGVVKSAGGGDCE
jgi:hypothetical protein